MQFTGEETQIMTKPLGEKVLNIKKNVNSTYNDFYFSTVSPNTFHS